MRTEKRSEHKDPPPRRRRKKRRKLRIFRFFFVLLLVLGFMGVAVGGTALFIIVKMAPPIDPSKASTLLEESTLVFDSDGKLLQKLSAPDEDRIIVPLSEIPKNLQNAVIAIEDERFMQHRGIDYKRVFGAIWYDLRTMSMAQGASTITMQMAKNMYTSPEKNWTRKIQDAYYALEIEKKLSKDEILYIYLNTMGMQGNKVGVQAASMAAFNKKVSELSLAQCAMLAGVTKSPGRYSPYILKKIEPGDDLSSIQTQIIYHSDGPKLPSEESLAIYKKLLEMGKIDRFDFNQLKNGDTYALRAMLNPKAKDRQEIVLRKMYELGMISEGEYKEAVAEPIQIELGKKKASGISSYFVDTLKQYVIADFVDAGYTETEAKNMWLNGGLRVYSTMDSTKQKLLESIVDSDKYFPGSFVDDSGIRQPQVSCVVMDQKNGHVSALIGGRDIGGEHIYNRAVRPRQPGSAIKPLSVYLPALQSGLTAGSVFSDSQITEGEFTPKNYGNAYQGNMTMRYLLMKSSNTGTYRVAMALAATKGEAIKKMKDSLKNLGITSVVTSEQNRRYNDESWSPLTLGGMTHGVSPLQMAAAFATIADEGIYHSPVFYTQITDANGKILMKPKTVERTVCDPQDAYILTDMLQDAVKSGTGSPAALPSMPAAGKTGTTQDRYDSWFVGYTPYYTASVWIGVDVPRELEDTSRMAARLWKAIMEPLHKDLPSKDFAKPGGLVTRSISKTQGGLAAGYTTDAYTEIFKSGTQPSSYAPEPVPTEMELLPSDTNEPIPIPGINQGGTETPPDSQPNTIIIPGGTLPQAPGNEGVHSSTEEMSGTVVIPSNGDGNVVNP